MAVAHKSVINVDILYIPVGLYKATKDISISFNQLCKESGERIKYKKYCPSCDKEVTNEDIIKGYEISKGKYVTFTNEELERMKSKKNKTIHILHFAKMADIDSILFEKNYYTVPEPGAEVPFEIFRQSLLKKKKVAVAQTVLGTKEELLVLYPTKAGIIAKFLYYQEEIQAMPVIQKKVEVSKEAIEMAEVIIESKTESFDPAAYHDQFQAKLRQAIETKARGDEIISTDTTPNNVIDYMEAYRIMAEKAKKKTVS